MRAILRVALCVLFIASCKNGGESTTFGTPAATVNTLFSAYDVQDVPEEEVLRRLRARERFPLMNDALFRSCFTDWQGDHDHGLGGYVFGRLVAGKDHLTITVDDDIARVSTGGADPSVEPIVLVKMGGDWKIDLKQSVPREVRQQLYEVYRRAGRR